MSQRSELKPCPFCGGKVEIKQDTRYPRSGKYKDEAVKAYEVICPNYDCIIYNADNKYFLTEEEAAKAWNSRASGWISVKDRLPENAKFCLVVCYEWDMFEDNWGKAIHFRILQYLPMSGCWNIKTPVRVLAWMPVPELPEMEMKQ